jgi:hypothetical protein
LGASVRERSDLGFAARAVGADAALCRSGSLATLPPVP